MGKLLGGFIPSDVKQALLLLAIVAALFVWVVFQTLELLEKREKRAAEPLELGVPRRLVETSKVFFFDVAEGTKTLKVEVRDADADVELRMSYFLLPGPRPLLRLSGSGVLIVEAPDAGRWWVKVKNPSGVLSAELVRDDR